MNKTPKPAILQGIENYNETNQDITPPICSPEFPNGCTDVEPDEAGK